MEIETTNNAVTVKGAFKTYDGKTYVLTGLDMNVKEGSIYGLLGPSGCGKSTLLNSIIGLVGLNSGTIELSVKSKHDLGFMPQAICLYDQLNVEEILTYYGTMSGMNKEKIAYRMDVLYKILELPDKNKCIPQLSGGQKRRVSLAVALMPDPKLLILDEPTVGVDPVLRQRIWEFLIDWSQSGKRTIIITTHYIEETKQAHTVGLLRDGVMLCEKSPYLIMEDCNTTYLEDAFLKLSQQQKPVEITKPPVANKNLTFSPLTHTKNTFASPRFMAEVKKNLLYMWRNISVAMFIFGLPTACIALFYFGNGREPEGLKLGIVNHDTPSGLRFCDTYVHHADTCDLNYLSCYYLAKLKEQTFNFVDYGDLDDAINHMNRTGLWGVLYFSPHFTNALSMRINEPLTTEDVVVDNSTITVYLDQSNKVIYDIVERKLRDCYIDIMKKIYGACGLPVEFVSLPIKFEKPVFPMFGFDIYDLRSFAGPGLITLLMFGMPLTYGIAIVIEEKNSGATSRSIVAGTSLFEVFAAHTLVQVGVQLLHTVTCIILMYYILKFPFESPYLSTLLLILQGLAGISFAFSLSTSFSSITVVASVATGSIMVSLMLGGIMWPMEGIHPSIQLLTWIAPNTYSTHSLRSLTLRGWDLTHKDVYLGFITCSMWIIVFTLFTYFYVKRNKAKAFLSKYM